MTSPKPLQGMIDKLLKSDAENGGELDCGDNSCFFAVKNLGGMRTNGGCRCFENAGFSRSAIGSAHKMLPVILKLRLAPESIKRQAEMIRMIRMMREALERYREVPLERYREVPLERYTGHFELAMIADEALARVEKLERDE